jgi:hypothetical protein
LRPRLLGVYGKFSASVLGQVRVEYLGPGIRAVYGMRVLGADAEMCLVNLQNCEAPSIFVEARCWVRFMAVRGEFGNRCERVRS